MSQCSLCLEDKELVKSHLIPRAMYDYCRTADSEPVLMTTEVMMQTSRQLQDHLLCKLCEDVLNVGGEQWLLPLLARIDQTFPLLGIVEKFPHTKWMANGRGMRRSAIQKLKWTSSFQFTPPLFLLTDHRPLNCPGPVGVTAHYCLNSFSCTYGSPRKCCKQKTYGIAKPFRCTYKNMG